jgi:hypothetical protein
VSYRKVMLETRGSASFHTALFCIARDVGTVLLHARDGIIDHLQGCVVSDRHGMHELARR